LQRRNFLQTSMAGVLLFSTKSFGQTKPDDELRERLVAEAGRVFANNRVESKMGKFHLPSFSTYKRFYAWDSGWNIISLTAFDQEAAYQELEAIFNFQVESGRIPHEAVPPEMSLEKDGTFKRLGYDLFDENGWSYMLDPPSFLMAAGELYNKTKDPRILDLLPKMEKCLEYLTGPRDLMGDGLVAAIHRWEPGTDMAPSYDEVMNINPWNPIAGIQTDVKGDATVRLYSSFNWDLDKIKNANEFILEDPGLNAITAAGAQAVSRLFEASGDLVKSKLWRDKAANIIEAMQEFLWDEDKGFFYPRYDAKNPKLAGKSSLTGLVPLMTGLVEKEKADRIIDKWLTAPEHFWAPSLVPFNSMAEMKKDPLTLHRLHLWRGSCIWINMNWMTARAAKVYGREDIAREITKRTAMMIDSEGFREYYRPQTGKGVGAENFIWPALVIPMIDEYGI
jgi:mannosylglycerate hydrolase